MVLAAKMSHHPTVASATPLTAPTQATVPPPFILRAREGNARTGVLRTKHGNMQTPAVLTYTRRGASLSMTPDMLETLRPLPSGMHIDTMQFLNNPTPAMLLEYGRGAHDFLALPNDCPVMASNRDPLVYEYGNKPSNDASVTVTIHSGGVQVTAEKYMMAIQALQPDLYVTLCDEVTADARPKRAATSVDRTTKWLDLCLAAQKRLGVDALPFASVSGGSSVAERRRAATAAAARNTAGYSISGLGTGEAPEERPSILAAALEPLPADRPRFVSGLLTPGELLDAVAEGIDLLDCGYAVQLTASGYAAAATLEPPWPLRPDGEDLTSCSDAVEGGKGTRGRDTGGTLHANVSSTALAAAYASGADSTKLNMWAIQYRSDAGPLLDGCTCFTCQRHSRAYVHHLLQAREMLADVLLEVHNTQHLLQFMGCVRAAIEGGTFQEYREWFKQEHPPHSTATGPAPGSHTSSRPGYTKRARSPTAEIAAAAVGQAAGVQATSAISSEIRAGAPSAAAGGGTATASLPDAAPADAKRHRVC